MYGHHTAGIKNFDSLKTWSNWAGALGLVSCGVLPVPLQFDMQLEWQPRVPIR